MRSICLTIAVSFTAFCGYGQVNAYARVSAIAGTTLTVTNVNETFDTFEDGEKIVIMQMQDNVIGTTTNTSGFGGLGAIGSAGLYELKTIASHTESAGVPATITVSGALANSYNTGSNSRVQVISFRRLGSPDYTTTGAITAVSWNGNVGGVVAIEVLGILTLAHNITANGAGFRGGVASNNFYSGSTGDCYNTTWITNTATFSGEKGEGIFLRTAAGQRYGQAKILNGGGGGNHINAGGGGGGNYTIGGNGGPGWSCATSAGGQGGISLASSINASRFFMGGGGGGGQQNDGVGSAGANGGGIIMLAVNEIRTTGSCAPLNISANGNNANNSSNDGSGGGGAGGTILFQVGNFNVAASCTINVIASGGNGGTVNSSAHGGGGGGGQGRVIYSGAQPTTNITTTTNNGTSGCNDSSSPCSNQAPAPSGSNNQGISDNAGSTPLPIELLDFVAEYIAEKNLVDIRWSTASELNNDFFTVQKSLDGFDFFGIDKIPGSVNSSILREYRSVDREIQNGVAFYRIMQTDFDGAVSYSPLRKVSIEDRDMFLRVYPNPAKVSSMVQITYHGLPDGIHPVVIVDARGATVFEGQVSLSARSAVRIENLALSPGLFIVKVATPAGIVTDKFLIE